MPDSKDEVLLTRGADQDIESIYDYIAEIDCQETADHVLDRLHEVVESLSAFPERGTYPRELIALGIRDYPLPNHAADDTVGFERRLSV